MERHAENRTANPFFKTINAVKNKLLQTSFINAVGEIGGLCNPLEVAIQKQQPTYPALNTERSTTHCEVQHVNKEVSLLLVL